MILSQRDSTWVADGQLGVGDSGAYPRGRVWDSYPPHLPLSWIPSSTGTRKVKSCAIACHSHVDIQCLDVALNHKNGIKSEHFVI